MSIESQKIIEINKLIDTKYTVLGFLDGYKNRDSKCIIECEIHKNGNDWGNPWNPTINNLKIGRGCPKCSDRYTHTEKELIKVIKNQKGKKYKFLSFVDNKFEGVNSKCVMECSEHGKGNDWGNPWNPTANSLKNGSDCPKCSRKYKHTPNDVLTEFNALDPQLKIIGFVNNQYENNHSKCILECKEHGKSNEWEIPCTPSVKDLRKSFTCIKCTNKYKYTKEEIINQLNELNNSSENQLNVIGLVDNEYINGHSTCLVECSTHGKCNEWNNPWTPSVRNLKSVVGCLKCTNKYTSTKDEVLEELNNKPEQKYKVIGFVNEEFNDRAQCIVECNTHGNGNLFSKPWNPTVNRLKSGHACPLCAIEGHELSTCLKNTQQYEHNRILYFVTFKNLKTNKLFYKIGLTTEKGVNRRFSKSKLEKDNIEIVNYEEIVTKNIYALIAEYWSLGNFQQHRKYMMHVLKTCAGGTECFSKDITKIMSLENIIKNSIDCFDFILKDFDLPENELNNALLEFNKINS